MAWASVVFSTALFRFATHCSTVLFVANKRHSAKKKILSKFFRKVTKDVHNLFVIWAGRVVSLDSTESFI
jgi:hypothetical protein